MTTVYQLTKAKIPVLISMPHNGTLIPDDIANSMHEYARDVVDTDWYMHKLYDFAKDMGCGIISPQYSRYVIDLNRDPEGKSLYPGADTTELCPTSQFNLKPLYLDGQKPSQEEINERVERYWQPYHNALNEELNRLKKIYPQVVLFEAHSIASHVPRFFDGVLPDFNFGTNDGESCSDSLIESITSNINFSPYSMVCNGRFKGGYITRYYGAPENNIHALQLELSQATYLNEKSKSWDEEKANLVIPKLESIIDTIIHWLESE